VSTAAFEVKQTPAQVRKLGLVWLAVCGALALHVTDEALTGFLRVYNPTVTALRQKIGFWPMPTFGFRDWLMDLSVGIVLLAALAPFAFQNARWMRPLIYFCAAVLCIGNACAHILFTVLGHTVASVSFVRPAPGFYSSPLLLVAGSYALLQLRKTQEGG
jgi:hypothetical protein